MVFTILSTVSVIEEEVSVGMSDEPYKSGSNYLIKKSMLLNFFPSFLLLFQEKHIILQSHLVLPLIDNINEATELRWERSANLRHYPML